MATQQRPLELCRDLEIVKQSVEESSTPQPGIQSAETNTLDDVATAVKEDGVKSRYTRAKQIRKDDEEDSTTSQQMHKAQRRTQRQAAANAGAINQIIQEEELHTLI